MWQAGWRFGCNVFKLPSGSLKSQSRRLQKKSLKRRLIIAFDKLKLDLFNRRFDVYTEALKISVDTVQSYNSGTNNPIPNERLDKLNEASFIFSSDAADRIGRIRSAAENIGVYRARLETMRQQGSPNLNAQEEVISTQLSELMTAAANS